MKFPSPPRGLKAIPWKLPIWIYRIGLGWMMDGLFLLLEHKGRKTGLPRRAVLEIVDSDPSSDIYYVVSGFGPGSDWYQNIRHDPKVTIQVGRKRIQVIAEQLEPQDAADLMIRYTEKHPGNLKALGRLLGYEIDYTPHGIRDFGRQIPVIRFSPRKDETESIENSQRNQAIRR